MSTPSDQRCATSRICAAMTQRACDLRGRRPTSRLGGPARCAGGCPLSDDDSGTLAVGCSSRLVFLPIGIGWTTLSWRRSRVGALNRELRVRAELLSFGYTAGCEGFSEPEWGPVG